MHFFPKYCTVLIRIKKARFIEILRNLKKLKLANQRYFGDISRNNYFLVQVFKRSVRSKDQFPSKLRHFVDETFHH